MKTYTKNPEYHGSAPFKFAILFVLLLALGSLLSLRAQDIMSFTVSSGTTTDRNWMFPADIAGAPGARTNNWNNIGNWLNGGTGTADATLVAGTITNAAGVLLPNVQATLHYGGNGGDGYSDRAAGGTNDAKMFQCISDAYPAGSMASYEYLSVTNIPYTNYNVYVYFLPDNGNGSANTRGGVFVITNSPAGTNCIYMKNQSNDVNSTQLPAPSSTTYTSTYIQSTTATIPAGGAAWSSIQGGNYGVFYGLTNSQCTILFSGLGNGSSGKDPFGNYVNAGNGAVRFKAAGFQIVQVQGGAATNLYLQNTSLTLHAGNPSGTQVLVLANLTTATGVNVTPNSIFSVDNTNVATVNALGMLLPGTNGTANLIVSYQNLSITNPISVIGPTSLALSLANTNLLAGNGQGDTIKATLLASFSDAANVDVSGYHYVSFSGGPNGVVAVTANGYATATGAGSFNITGYYDGLSVTTNNVGMVAAYTSPGGQAINVDITDVNDPMSFHDLSGAPGIRTAYWNNMVLSGATASNNIYSPFDSQGNIQTNMVVTVTGHGNGAGSGEIVAGTISTNEGLMFNTVFDQGYNNANGLTALQNEDVVVVSNVPYGSYDVYFYCYNDSVNSNRSGFFRLTSETDPNTGIPPERWRRNDPTQTATPTNNGVGYEEAIKIVDLPSTITQVPFGNYVHFVGCTNSTLSVQWSAGYAAYLSDGSGDNTARLRFAGFQIVKSLSGLTATNMYLQSAVPNLLPGNLTATPSVVLADFNDGTKGGNITSLSGINFSSSDNNVFTVNANGVITPGSSPGSATLTVTYQTLTVTQTITTLAPLSVSLGAQPSTVYIDSINNLTNSQATVFATFNGYTNVNIGGFNGVTFVDQGSPAATLAANGAITVKAVGTAGLGVTYVGTTWTIVNGLTVISTNSAPVLKHLYVFTNAPNSSMVVDSIGGANGTVFGPLGVNKPIVFDGSRVIFPGDGVYSNTPYISLPPYLVSKMGDVTIEMWGGQSQLNAWARFYSFGNTAKGTSPYNLGVATSGIQLLASYAGTGLADDTSPGTGDFETPYALTNGAEYHMVVVCAPNAGIAAFYVNGILITNGVPTAALLSTSVNDSVDWLGVSLSNTDGPLAGWMNKLAIYEGAMSASQVAVNYTSGQSIYLPPATSSVSTNVVPVTFSVSGGYLNLAWPSDHLGWRLVAQTNSLSTGLNPNANAWFAVPNSAGVTNMAIPINPANGAVFYRLVYP